MRGLFFFLRTVCMVFIIACIGGISIGCLANYYNVWFYIADASILGNFLSGLFWLESHKKQFGIKEDE